MRRGIEIKIGYLGLGHPAVGITHSTKKMAIISIKI
jgi:hypothetical protein